MSRACWQSQPQLSLALHRLSQSLEARKCPPSAEPNARSAEQGTSNPSGQTRRRPRSSVCTAATWACSRIRVLTEMVGTRGIVRLIETDNHGWGECPFTAACLSRIVAGFVCVPYRSPTRWGLSTHITGESKPPAQQRTLGVACFCWLWQAPVGSRWHLLGYCDYLHPKNHPSD